MIAYSFPKAQIFFESLGFAFLENTNSYFFSKMIDALYLKKENFLLKFTIDKTQNFDNEIVETVKKLSNYRNQIFGNKVGRLAMEDFIDLILSQIKNK
jgi:hypothetical protein